MTLQKINTNTKTVYENGLNNLISSKNNNEVY